jgi:Glucodextranase, domain B
MLAGVSVAFAAGALQPGRPIGTIRPTASGSPAPSAALVASLAPPVLDTPAAGLTRAAVIDVTGSLTAELPAGGPYKVRVYVNDLLRADARLARRDTEFTVADVPLVEGANTVTATIAGPLDETARSLPISLERDGTAPGIDIASPSSGSTIYGETMLLSGTTEAGATVKVVDRSNGAESATTAGTAGAFSVLVPLRSGSNSIDLSAVDLAGNVSRKSMRVTRAESQAAITLQLSRDTYDLATLPQALSMVAHVLGSDGKPVDGADVTFSISTPGQMTVTHETTTESGTAVWSNYPLTADGAQAGQGLVTVLATLAGGQTLADSATFTFR